VSAPTIEVPAAAVDEAPVSFGWRPAVRVNYSSQEFPSYENPRAVWSATAFGPCSSCTARCRKYGPGGNPLCPRCLAEAITARSGRAS